MTGDAIPLLMYGLANTAALFVIAWIIGLPIGLAAGLWVLSSKPLHRVANFLAMLFLTIPFICFLFRVHYPLQAIIGINWSGYTTTLFLLITYVALGVASAVANEMADTMERFEDLVKVLAIPPPVFFRQVALPTALLGITPRLLGHAIASIHVTMFASLIGVNELFRSVQRLNAEILKPVELFSLMAIIYAALCLPLYGLAILVASRLKQERDIA